jgi:hypothetical protein
MAARRLFALAAILGLAACAGDETSLTDNPLHFAAVIDRAVAAGSELPAGLPEPVEWRFDDAQVGWKPAVPFNPTIAPPRVTRTEDALRLTLTEATRNPNGVPRGGIYVDLPGWAPENWGHVEVRARTTDMEAFSVGFNRREGSGSQTSAPYPFQIGGGFANTNNDGDVHTYQLRADRPQMPQGEWRQLGLWFGAAGPASIDILSIRAVPKEAPFAESAIGARTVGEANVPTMYARAPGRIEFPVRVPSDGRLDVSLGVLRDDAPVTFRVIVTPDGSQPDTLLHESWADRTQWAKRSLDLSGVAGRTARLTFEADAQRTGTVALWGAPTLYTPSRMSVGVLDDATGSPTPVRVRLVDARGATAPLSDDAIAIMWGPNDRASGYGFQPDSSFYVDGGFGVELQPGTYQLSLSKGQEYLKQHHELVVEPGGHLSETFRLKRWIDMPERGWYSADDHIHLRRSPRENPLILKWVAAEDIHVGALLQMGDFWTTYFAQYAWGRDGVYQLEDYMLSSGQEEPRTHEVGHTISLAADDFVRFSGNYYHYDRVFDRVQELGGVSGYAHQGVLFHGYRGLTLDVLRGKVDFVELLQFCTSQEPLHLEHYYHFLDLGFKLTATAGSDFPWCGIGPGWSSRIGDARFYAYLGDDFSFDNWRASLHAGNTFVSSGPVIDLKVNGRIPGDELDVPPGSRLTITATASGHAEQVPLERLEIVAHGEVLQTVTDAEPGQTAAQLVVEMELTVEHGVWIAARAQAGLQQGAHTTPVYVTVDGSGFHNPETALAYLALNEQYLAELEREIAQPNETVNQLAWRFREGLEARILETRAVIGKLRAQFAADQH